MTSVPSTSTSSPNFAPIIDAALESYRRKTKKDLASDPLLHSLQYCDTPEAILSVLREQVNQSQSSDDKIIKWAVPTVKVLRAFSKYLGQVGERVNIIFAGIGVLLSVSLFMAPRDILS